MIFKDFTDLVGARYSAAKILHNLLLSCVEKSHIQFLMLVQLVHGLTERDGVRTPGVPGRSTPHHPRLAGLHALQEVVVLLLLLAGLLRPVEEVVLGDGDLVGFIIARLCVLLRLVMHEHPRKDAAFYDRKVELGIVDEDSVVEAGVEVEGGVSSVLVRLVWVCEGVADTKKDQRHLAAPQGGVPAVVMPHGGVQGESVVSDTALDI